MQNQDIEYKQSPFQYWMSFSNIVAFCWIKEYFLKPFFFKIFSLLTRLYIFILHFFS